MVSDQHGAHSTSPLEREAELAAVQVALDGLSRRSVIGGSGAGQGGLLSFTGPAGAGKSTMLAEVRRLAAGRECTILFARGGEREQATAFHAVRHLLQPLLASYSERERHDVLGDWYGIVGPCVGLCPAEEGTAPDPQGVRDGLDWMVTNVAARRGPLVIVIDDAHWVDPESLRWLTSFAARVEEFPVLIVVAYRSEELPAEAKAFSQGVGGDRSRPLDLAPLSYDAVSELMRGALGTEVDEDFSHEAWLATGGNAFHVVELAAKVRNRELPPTRENARFLRDMVGLDKGIGLLEQLDDLGTSAVRLAWAASVLGSDGTLSMAATMANVSQVEAARLRERLRDARILRCDEPLEFVHPLVAAAVYGEIPWDATRVGMHGAAAAALLAAGKGPTVAARHFLEVYPEGADDVVENLHAAAREYLRTGAPEAARRCLERALLEPPSPEDRAELLYELGSPALMLDPASSVNYLRAALDEFGLNEELRQNVVIRLGRALSYSDQLLEAVGLLEDEISRATDPRVRLRMLAEHFMLAVFSTDNRSGPVPSRRLAKIAERLTGSDQVERYLLGLHAWGAMVRGEPVETVLDYAERALGSDGMSWTDEDWGFNIPMLVALTFLHCDHPDRADELLSDGVREFDRQGWRGIPLALAYIFLGQIRYRSGRLTDAEDYLRAALRIADQVNPEHSVHYSATGSLIQVLLARGKLSAADELAREHGLEEPFASGAYPEAQAIPDVQAVRGELLLARGMAKEASEELAEAGRRFDERGMQNPGWCVWLLHLALASQGADNQQAQELAQEAVQRTERFGASSAVGQALRVAARVSDGPERIGLMRRAVSHLEQSPAMYELATALVELGSMQRSVGLLREAGESLYRGVDIAVQCGAEAVVERARDELAAAGLRPRRLGAGL